jgi:hypothetical protein
MPGKRSPPPPPSDDAGTPSRDGGSEVTKQDLVDGARGLIKRQLAARKAALREELRLLGEPDAHAAPAPTASSAVYDAGNEWQRDRYAHMSTLNRAAGISFFGRTVAGNSYQHLLPTEFALHNCLGDPKTLSAMLQRFAVHKAGDLDRALCNTVASQPCCFNLFAPLQRDLPLASELFSKLLRKAVTVDEVEIEFTPREADDPAGDESLGDQSKHGGTDADVAVFFTAAAGQRGVVLIEFKYIEDEFSQCGSYGKKKLTGTDCTTPGWFAKQIDSDRSPSDGCGYKRYCNWHLLRASRALSVEAVRALDACPFRGSLNQLWRNLLLAERVATVRKLDEFHFWVLSPAQNKALWRETATGDVEQAFRSLLKPLGASAFRRLELDRDFVQVLERLATGGETAEWLRRFRARYLPVTDPGQPTESR